VETNNKAFQESIDLAEEAKAGVVALLKLAGRDPQEPGVIDTPSRYVKAFLEIAGPKVESPEQILDKVFDVDDVDQMIVVGPIDFVSMCEHHLLPFTGQAWVAYIPSPGGGVVGLSKIPRLVKYFAGRPQIQERLTKQISDTLSERLNTLGTACVVRGSHACMSLRGVKDQSAAMQTAALTGVFRDDHKVREEFFHHIWSSLPR